MISPFPFILFVTVLTRRHFRQFGAFVPTFLPLRPLPLPLPPIACVGNPTSLFAEAGKRNEGRDFHSTSYYPRSNNEAPNIPIWVRLMGFSAWGIQTGPVAAL